jgi:mono/diheme cytochrome c family protein
MSARSRPVWLTVAFLGMGAAVTLFVLYGLHGRGISARRSVAPLEARAARAAWLFLVPTASRRAANPIPSTPDVLTDAEEHWADHCAACHGSDGGGAGALSRHMYPPVPDLRAPSAQALTDGEVFYAIEEGVPFTGMPAWTTGSDEGARESWMLVDLIRHLPKLSAEEQSRIEAAMPKSAADIRREREIEDFLKPSTGGAQ